MRYEKILVTGGSGRLGWYVVEELLPHCDLTVLDRARPAQDVPYIEADALDLDAVRRALDGKDAVVHLAAIDLGVPAESEEYFGVNVMCAWNVLQASHETAVRNVVIASSIAATGLEEGRPEFPPRYLPVDEAHAMEPVHAYSVSKLVVEEVARSLARRGDLRVICLRPVLIAFPSSFPTLIERADDDAFPWLYFYVRPEDTARAFRLALERAGGPAFDVAALTAADSCHASPTLDPARRVLGTLPEGRRPELYEANPRASVFDGSHAREAIGFEPTSDWPTLRREFEAGGAGR